MKVLHVIPSVAPCRGGPSRAIVEMVRALRENDVDATILATNDNGPSELKVPIEQPTAWEKQPAIFLKRWSPPIHPVREFAFAPRAHDWLERNVRKYDIVHAHAVFSYLPGKAMDVCRKAGILYVARTMGHLDMWSLKRRSWKKKIALAFGERARLRGAAAIHVTSENEDNSVRSALGGDVRTCIIPLGVTLPDGADISRESARKDLKLSEHATWLVFLSRIHPKKNIESLIDVLTQDESYHLAIAGDGDERYVETLKQLAVQKGVDSRITWMGWVDGWMRGALFKAGDVFVLPSLSENFGLAAVEAAACGIRVVVSAEVDAGPMLESVGAATISRGHLSLAIKRALDQPHDPVEQSRRVLNNFGWNTVGKKIRAMYEDILKNA